jgi:hypothetical protein
VASPTDNCTVPRERPENVITNRLLRSGFRLAVLCFPVLALGLPLLGCGPDDPYDYAPVTGTVTYKGAAVEGATVTFIPANGRRAFGTTDAQGKYTLFTVTTPGCTTGISKVTIVKTESSGGTASGAETGIRTDIAEPGQPAVIPTTPGSEGVGSLTPGSPPPSATAPTITYLIPERYSAEATTPLTNVEVKEGDNVHDFDLTDE